MSDPPNQRWVASSDFDKDDAAGKDDKRNDDKRNDDKKVLAGLVAGGVVLLVAVFLVMGALPSGKSADRGPKTSPPVVVTIPVEFEQVEEVPLSPSEWSDVLEAFWVSVSTTDQSGICEAVTLFGAEESASIVVLTISDETGGEAPTMEQATEWLSRKCQ